jgi:hypothetical protein
VGRFTILPIESGVRTCEIVYGSNAVDHRDAVGIGRIISDQERIAIVIWLPVDWQPAGLGVERFLLGGCG